MDNLDQSAEDFAKEKKKNLTDEILNSIGFDESNDQFNYDIPLFLGDFESRFNRKYKDDFEEILNNRLKEKKAKYLEQFKGILDDAQENNVLYDILVHFRRTLDEYEISRTNDYFSPINVTEDLKIVFPNFQDFEISFSPITQVVYILFTLHPEGINIKELAKYENEILELFYKLSQTTNLDSIYKSVQDLINPERKAIYTHISRIKSTLFEIMGETIAKSYIITSEKFGSELKFIPIIYVVLP